RAPITVAAVAAQAPPAPVGISRLNDTRFASAEWLGSAGGTTVAYSILTGDCDEQIRAAVYETDEVVVVGGTVKSYDGTCDATLVRHPVSVTLTKPLGKRPLVGIDGS